MYKLTVPEFTLPIPYINGAYNEYFTVTVEGSPTEYVLAGGIVVPAMINFEGVVLPVFVQNTDQWGLAGWVCRVASPGLDYRMRAYALTFDDEGFIGEYSNAMAGVSALANFIKTGGKDAQEISRAE